MKTLFNTNLLMSIAGAAAIVRLLSDGITLGTLNGFALLLLGVILVYFFVSHKNP